MKKSLFLIATVMAGAIYISEFNSAYAAPPSNTPIACNVGGGSLSVAKGALATQDFRYVGQPVFQDKNPLGATPDEVRANFADVIAANFQNESPEHILNNLSDRELQDLAKLYTANTQGNTQPLLKVFAQNLSDQALVRVAETFGTEPVREAVNSYATTNVQSAFNEKIATLKPVAIPPSPASEPATSMAAPTLDMTIPEIYLEFRTAPVGNVGPAAAIAETTMYVSKNVGFAATVGWAIGTGISNLIETYDPSLNDAIGGTVAGMVDAANQSWDEYKQGQYQASFDALFGSPVSNSGNPAGDFGEFSAMDYFLNGCP